MILIESNRILSLLELYLSLERNFKALDTQILLTVTVHCLNSLHVVTGLKMSNVNDPADCWSLAAIKHFYQTCWF